jgi:hypothetical protein
VIAGFSKALRQDFRSDEASTTGEYELHGFGFDSKYKLEMNFLDAPFDSTRYKALERGRYLYFRQQ